MIREEIDASRPVFYAATNKFEEGHAFVVDGYRGDYFSLNYGWSGQGNDYYLLRPSVSLSSQEVTEFCQWACMTTHIYPDRGGEVYVNFFDDTLVPFPWDFQSKTFTVGGRSLYVESSGDGEAWLRFVLYNRKGGVKAMATEPVLVSSTNPYIPELTCSINCDIEDGDCLKLAQLKDDEWVPIQQSANAYLEFHTGKKLPDLVVLDYMLYDEDYPDDEEDPYLYLRGAKDIYWEMWSEDTGNCLATSQSFSYEPDFPMLVRWDRETNEYRTIFIYQPGNYRLILRNFDEEVTLHVKL
jgi:hypothetical protein